MRFDAICDLSCAFPEDPETLVAMFAFGISISEDMFTLSQSCLNRYGHLSLVKFQIQMFQMCFLKRTLTTALSAQTSMRKYDETNTTLNSDEIEQSGVRSKIP
jgi:hypothetical protein